MSLIFKLSFDKAFLSFISLKILSFSFTPIKALSLTEEEVIPLKIVKLFFPG